jgi:Holliday junction resolvase
MDKSESEIQKEIIDYLKAMGAIVIRHNSGSSGRNNLKLSPVGFPDLQAILARRVLFLEVKTATGELRQSQRDMIAELYLRKQEVFVVRSVADVKRILEE